MDQALKTRWVDALRSDRYKQGHYQLYTPRDNAYCCLGVLATIEGIGISPNGVCLVGDEGKENPTYTLDPIRKLLDSDNTEENTVAKLIEMNDGEGKTFPEIADWIEANL